MALPTMSSIASPVSSSDELARVSHLKEALERVIIRLAPLIAEEVAKELVPRSGSVTEAPLPTPDELFAASSVEALEKLLPNDRIVLIRLVGILGFDSTGRIRKWRKSCSANEKPATVAHQDLANQDRSSGIGSQLTLPAGGALTSADPDELGFRNRGSAGAPCGGGGPANRARLTQSVFCAQGSPWELEPS